MITDQDDVSWQSVLYDLVKTEQMNPWDVDISLITQKYIATVKGMKEANLKLSGKVVLASAILLKIKSKRLLGEDMNAIDHLFHSSDEQDDAELYDQELEDFDFNQARASGEIDPYKLIPRTPQPRKRKVSIYDLIGALEKAMEVRRRRIIRHMPDAELDLRLPERRFDISKVLKSVYGDIKIFFSKNKDQKMPFTNLVEKDADKMQKIHSFIPLLYLEHQQKIQMEQEKPFDPIHISMYKKDS